MYAYKSCLTVTLYRFNSGGIFYDVILFAYRNSAPFTLIFMASVRYTIMTQTFSTRFWVLYRDMYKYRKCSFAYLALLRLHLPLEIWYVRNTPLLERRNSILYAYYIRAGLIPNSLYKVCMNVDLVLVFC